jgi:hypothetical protein
MLQRGIYIHVLPWKQAWGGVGGHRKMAKQGLHFMKTSFWNWPLRLMASPLWDKKKAKFWKWTGYTASNLLHLNSNRNSKSKDTDNKNTAVSVVSKSFKTCTLL